MKDQTVWDSIVAASRQKLSGETQPYALVCVGCGKKPDEIIEYQMAAEEYNETPDEYVRKEEGTLNKENGHFLCTPCYFAADCPSSPGGWIAP